MPWIVNLAQRNTRKPGKRKESAKTSPTQITFSIMERVPVFNSALKDVWETLKQAGNKQFVVDAEHAEEAFQAYVLDSVDIKGEILASIERALDDARVKALETEKAKATQGPLGRALDRNFEVQQEWLALRQLLIKAIVRPGPAGGPSPKAKQKLKRALLLIDA